MCEPCCKGEAYRKFWGACGILAGILAMCVGCGLYESPGAFGGLADGDACGPEGMGSYSADRGECRLGSLDEVVQASSPDQSLVFVHPEGSKEGAGSKEEPFGRVPKAVRVAQKRDADGVVIAGDEIYRGAVELKNGVSLVGGWEKDWSPSKERRPTLISETSEKEGQNAAITGKGLREATYVRNVVVESRSEGTTKYGARMVDVKELRIENTVIRAGDGKDGRDGADGEPGADGADGKAGGQPETDSAGGRGANGDCPAANGGNGGRGGFEGNAGARSGETGETSDAGVQGGGESEDGFGGGDGQNGGAGADGRSGEVREGRWIADGRGERGADGENGEGGGGGGGGRVSGGDGTGGGGGGGGAGGCGGQGGEGGDAGGASIGLLVVDSEIVIRKSEIVSGNGGDGGAGGVGGPGGKGGVGGNGVQGTGNGEAGGDGGNGGDGGLGGEGGDGRGGVSFGIVCDGDVTVEGEGVSVQIGEGGGHGGDLTGRAESKRRTGCRSME